MREIDAWLEPHLEFWPSVTEFDPPAAQDQVSIFNLWFLNEELGPPLMVELDGGECEDGKKKIK